MTVLTDDSLEFAKDHISKFYDTDFFPKPYEYYAIWHCWDDLKRELMSRNVEKLYISTPNALPWKKPKNGYRVVHQLEPIDSIIYTALTYQIAKEVELARVPQHKNVACAYRIEISEGSFFSKGSGYDQFRDASKYLASKNKFVLVTDISDFYNQIYLHRLNNAIEHADRRLKGLSDDIENFLTRINDKSSQGVPVGPAASIVLAEATLNDVDQYLIDQHIEHTRYVNDFRIFAQDKETLEIILQKLTLYLYKNHRLSLSSEKTALLATSEFISKIENPYEIEKLQVIEEIEILDPYSNHVIDYLYLEDEEKTRKLIQEKILDAFTNLVKKPLDLGYTRALIRQARAGRIDSIIEIIIKNFDFFLPVINNIIIYLNDVVNDENLQLQIPFFSQWLQSKSSDNELPRLWVEWYLTQHNAFLMDETIKGALISSPNLITQAKIAVSSKNLSWIRDKKSKVLTSGTCDRRAILFASQILPSDERKVWLKQIENETPYILDRFICRWLNSKINNGNFYDFDDDIPF